MMKRGGLVIFILFLSALYGPFQVSGHDRIPAGGGSGPLVDQDCDYEVDHQSLVAGATWGAGSGDSPGDVIFTEGGIPVAIDRIDLGGGSYGFDDCTVELIGSGPDRQMNLDDIANIYDISALGVVTYGVSFDFFDSGGVENLQVNGGILHVGDMDAMPATVAPGVVLSVSSYPFGGGVAGTVTLQGNVYRLLVAGQGLKIDDICVVEGGAEPQCDRLSDNESLPAGMAWGSPFNDWPGLLMFTEDGIDAYLDELEYDNGWSEFYFMDVRIPNCPAGTGQALYCGIIGVLYDFQNVGPVGRVSFGFCATEGFENLGVDGLRYIGNIEDIPADYFPGQTVEVDYFQDGSTHGTVTVTGNIHQLLIAGVALSVDDLCVEQGVSAVPGAVEGALVLGPNHPNPFNPGTTIDFSMAEAGHVTVSIVDLEGRRVATLLDEILPAGDHSVVWNGRDDGGRRAASGMYLVTLRKGDRVVTRKIAMLK